MIILESSSSNLNEVKYVLYKKITSNLKDTYIFTLEENNNFFLTSIQVLVHNAGSLTC